MCVSHTVYVSVPAPEPLCTRVWQADAFEKGVDKTDARVNDGNQYKGLMDPKAYKAKRAQLAKDEEEVRSWPASWRCCGSQLLSS